MSHTNYKTSSSAFHVANESAFLNALARANITPVGQDSIIDAHYFYDKKSQEFVISGHFDGNIGTFDSETDEQRDRPLSKLIHKYADLSRNISEVNVITVFSEQRQDIIISTGATIEKIYKSSKSNKRYIKTIANAYTD
jgi:P2-related tail formation protein